MTIAPSRISRAPPPDSPGRRPRDSWTRCAAFTMSSFRGRTRRALLEQIRPDVHCKGTDYTVESVPVARRRARYGGRTAIVGDSKTTRPATSSRKIVRDAEAGRPLTSGSRPQPSANRGWESSGFRACAHRSTRALGDIVHAIPVAAACAARCFRRASIAGRREAPPHPRFSCR